MNQRIQALVEQATRGAMWPGDPDAGELNVEKFAELLVQECAQVAKQTDSDDGVDYKSGRAWAGIDILKHFGVAE
jgi:hypothetical protein